MKHSHLSWQRGSHNRKTSDKNYAECSPNNSAKQIPDFHFRQYKPEYARFTQPDSLLPDVYDPQQLNRYAFERNNPYKYTDEDGHNPYVAAMLSGFIWGSIGYMATTPIDEENEKWGRVKNAYLHGANTGIHAVASVSLVFKGGAIRIAKGSAFGYSMMKNALLGSSEYAVNEMIDGEDIDGSDMIKDAVSSSIPIFKLVINRFFTFAYY